GEAGDLRISLGKRSDQLNHLLGTVQNNYHREGREGIGFNSQESEISEVHVEAFKAKNEKVKPPKQPISASHRYVTPKYKFVPVCHYCGVKGHIRPKCYKLMNFSKRNFQSHCNGSVKSQIDDLLKKSQMLNDEVKKLTNSSMNWNRGQEISGSMKNPKVVSNHQVKPKSKEVWVRSSNLR
ncbi:hypothetical protein DVA67_036015, partial [Solirubrobacter sp. CPCC 204708]|nr:hypothetical protein [Solirubrobacter deserti]